MGMTNDDIKRIGSLARLKLSETEVAAYRKDFSGILGYVDQLRTAKLLSVKPKRSGAATRLRSDKAMAWPPAERDGALRQAGERPGGQLKVKRIL